MYTIKKKIASLFVMLMALTIFFTGCAVPSGTDEVSLEPEVSTENLIDTQGSRITGDWPITGTDLTYAQDIAAYDDIYVISADGRTVYKKIGGNFYPLNISNNSILHNDPADKIDCCPESRRTNYADNKGVYIVTVSGNIYSLITAFGEYKWMHVPGILAKDITANLDGDIWVISKTNGSLYKQTSSGGWSEVEPFSNAVALSNNSARITGLYVVTSTGGVYEIRYGRRGPYKVYASSAGIDHVYDIETTYNTTDNGNLPAGFTNGYVVRGAGYARFYNTRTKTWEELEGSGFVDEIGLDKRGWLWNANRYNIKYMIPHL